MFGLFTTIEIDVFEIEGVDMAGEVTQKGETDVDQEVGATTGNHEDSDGWEEDCDYYHEDCGDCLGHLDGGFGCVVCVVFWLVEG